MINVAYQSLRLTFQSCQSADLVCQLFSTVDNVDVNIHMVSLRGQFVHTSTCDSVCRGGCLVVIDVNNCLEMHGYD